MPPPLTGQLMKQTSGGNLNEDVGARKTAGKRLSGHDNQSAHQLATSAWIVEKSNTIDDSGRWTHPSQHVTSTNVSDMTDCRRFIHDIQSQERLTNNGYSCAANKVLYQGP